MFCLTPCVASDAVCTWLFVAHVVFLSDDIFVCIWCCVTKCSEEAGRCPVSKVRILGERDLTFLWGQTVVMAVSVSSPSLPYIFKIILSGIHFRQLSQLRKFAALRTRVSNQHAFGFERYGALTSQNCSEQERKIRENQQELNCHIRCIANLLLSKTTNYSSKKVWK